MSAVKLNKNRRAVVILLFCGIVCLALSFLPLFQHQRVWLLLLVFITLLAALVVEIRGRFHEISATSKVLVVAIAVAAAVTAFALAVSQMPAQSAHAVVDEDSPNHHALTLSLT